MFLGLAGNESSFATSVVQSLDFTRRPVPGNALMPVLERDISSAASNVMTMLVKGNAALFENEFAKEYTLAVEDMISLHFLNDEKRMLVEELFAKGLAFATQNMLENDPNSRTSMKLVPTAALLAYCPLQTMRGMYGCNARREIQQRTIDTRTDSIISLTMRNNEDAHFAHTRAGLWSQMLLGGSEYARQLGYNHSKIMFEQNDLNARYRKGFMISPTIPWRQAEIDAESGRVDSIFDLSQHMITTVLISLDTNYGQLFEANIEITIPSILPLTRQQVIDHQFAIAHAYALGANLDTSNIYVDVNSIVENTDRVVQSRNLLQSDSAVETQLVLTESEFDIITGFASAAEVDALQEANSFIASIQAPNSLVSQLALTTVNTALARKVQYYSMPRSMFNRQRGIDKPRNRQACYDDTTWEMAVIRPRNASDTQDITGFVGCQGRRIGLPFPNTTAKVWDTAMHIRGPMQDSDFFLD